MRNSIIDFQNIMEEFFSDFDISMDIFGQEEIKGIEKIKTLISNKTLIISNIRQNVNAVITLEDNRRSDTYDGFGVKIVHKDNGVIDYKWFGFDAYMPHNCQLGTEKTKRPFSIIGYVSSDSGWYGSAPNENENRKMVQAIMKYIGMWV